MTKDTEAVLDMPRWSARDTPLERVSRVTRHLVVDGKQEIDNTMAGMTGGPRAEHSTYVLCNPVLRKHTRAASKLRTHMV